MCVGVLLQYMSVHHVCAWYPKKPEVLDPLELEFQTIVSYDISAGNWIQVLWKMFLTTESSLQTQSLLSLGYFDCSSYWKVVKRKWSRIHGLFECQKKLLQFIII